MTSQYVKNLITKAYIEKATFLDLGNCGLTEIPEDIKVLAPFLTALNLGDYYRVGIKRKPSQNSLGLNNFSKANHPFDQLKVFLNLDTLYLANTRITTQFKSIAVLKSLTSLDIRNNRLTDAGAESISKLSGLTSLDISYNNLTDAGAEFIPKFSGLNSLNIRSNKLTDAGAESVSKLSGLTSLDISYNKLTDAGAEFIPKLSGLTSLNIRNNRLTDAGAESISKLNGLTSLYISDNKLTDSGAESISQLSSLTSLDISDNTLTDAGAESISKLSNLISLDISNNKLTDAGAESISRLNGLTLLDIKNNDITSLQSIKSIIINLARLNYFSYDTNKVSDLPKEIGNDIEALRAYFSSTKKIANTLVKMVLIGNTTAGKSSLADFLISKGYKEGRESTHGIKLWRWEINDPPNSLQVNIWDFGGQDYYHATHNLFLEDKTIFLLLQTTKVMHMQQNDIDIKQYLSPNYWLGNIRNITQQDSAVWYIQSKSDTESLYYLDTSLVNRYTVSRQYKISVKKAHEKEPYAVNDFEYFRNHLLQELQSLAKTELPASWVEIRDTYLPQWRKSALSLNKEAFKVRCEQALQNNKVLLNDLIASWDGLLPYLRGCGEIVSFEKGILQDTVFLSAEKLTEGIYTVLSKKAYDNRGEFTLDDLRDADRERGKLYLEVLLAFEIIFKKPGGTEIYVAPQYLPENPHTRHFQHLIEVAYIIRFPDYMSRSLITRFLVKYAGGSEDNYYWRYGAFFKIYELNVFVRIDAEEQKVYVHAEDGKNKFTVMKELLLFFTLPDKSLQDADVAIQESAMSFDREAQKRPGLITDLVYGKVISQEAAIDKIPGEIELSLNNTDFACIKDLREAIELRAYKIKSIQGGYIEFNAVLHQLLTTGTTLPKKIFLSYSHKDEEYKKELDTHFAALKRSGKVETWQDRKIMAGEDWNKSIEDALLNADIALLLLSPDFMASDYIWNEEIPKAIEKGVTVVPIFIRPCDFKESVFEIHKKQGLPGGSKWIISSMYQYRDEAYLEVVEGMKKLLG